MNKYASSAAGVAPYGDGDGMVGEE